MEYKTHLEVGKATYIVSVPFQVKLGLMPDIASATADLSAVVLGGTFALSLVLGWKAAMFGAQFPDLDMAGSAPDKNHPIIGKILRLFGLKHRGKFSHSFESLTLFFMLPFIAVTVFGGSIVEGLLEQSFLDMAQVCIFSTWVGAMSHLIADMWTKTGVWTIIFNKQIRFVPSHSYFTTGYRKEVDVQGNVLQKILLSIAPSWEMLFRKTVKVLIPIFSVITIIVIIGK